MSLVYSGLHCFPAPADKCGSHSLRLRSRDPRQCMTPHIHKRIKGPFVVDGRQNFPHSEDLYSSPTPKPPAVSAFPGSHLYLSSQDKMKRGAKEGIFCPEQALILNDITIFLGKFDPSQWVGFEKRGRVLLLPRRPAEIPALKAKTMGRKRKWFVGTSAALRGFRSERRGSQTFTGTIFLRLTLSRPNNLSFCSPG